MSRTTITGQKPDGTTVDASFDSSGNLNTTGPGGGGAVTVADGADASLGALADAAASVGATGSVQAKLRLITSQLDAMATLLSTGANVASETIGGDLYQIIKLGIGAAGASADLAFGQAVMAASLPVAFASNQTTLPVAEQNRYAPNVTTSGLYVALGAANTDPGGVAIPSGAKSLIVWFETSTSDVTMIRGRVGFNASVTAVGSITGTDALLAYSPATPVEYPVPSTATHVHVACSTASAVVRGGWLF